jgi:hypothetical protein
MQMGRLQLVCLFPLFPVAAVAVGTRFANVDGHVPSVPTVPTRKQACVEKECDLGCRDRAAVLSPGVACPSHPRRAFVTIPSFSGRGRRSRNFSKKK